MAQNTKYEMVYSDQVTVFNRVFTRIRALRDIGSNVKAGDLGGYIMSEKNLSAEGECWVYQGAKVADNCIVKDNARLWGEAFATGNVVIRDDAKVFDSVELMGDVVVGQQARVYGSIALSDAVQVLGNYSMKGRGLISSDKVFS